MKRLFCVIVLGCVTFVSGTAQITPSLYLKTDKEKMTRWVDSVFNALTPEERIGQLFMPVVNPENDAANMRRLKRYVEELKVGGILFHKGDPGTQAFVTNQIQKQSRIPLLISLDGEWGLSMRLENTTRFPKNMMLGAIENDTLIYMYGEEVGRQCKEMGIHINFAPDLDVNSNTDNPVIGLRSFGEDANAVADKGIAYARGLENTGILSVAKHFPGHGDTSTDSHYTLPVVNQTKSRLDSIELLPFKKYIDEGFAGVMTGHLYVPALDKSKNPASLSPRITTGLLQKELGFSGLCFTDALAMKGATTNKKDNPSVQALLAGNDILLAPASPFSDFEAIREAIESGILDKTAIEEKCKKVLAYKYIAGLSAYRPVDLKGLSGRLNSSHAAWLAGKLNAEAITLLKNENGILPLKELDKRKIAVLSIGAFGGNEFQAVLSRYDSVAYFQIDRNTPGQKADAIYKSLMEYDVILCGIHTVRIPENPGLRSLSAKKEVVLAFFTLPYFVKDYKASVDQAKAVVMAYENTPMAQEYTAQLIYGGIGAKGKLPVSIPELYYAGSGIFTEKIRLGYQEPEEVGMDASRFQEIDKIVQEGLDEQAFPGCQVLVAKDGVIVYEKAFGYYDYSKKQAVTTDAVYDLASSSKAAGTVPAVMKAYDEKKFTLTSKISEFIPELKGSDKGGLAIKELLYHESGVVPTINFYLSAIDKESYTGSLYSASRNATHPVRFDSRTFVRNDFKYLPSLVSSTPKEGFGTEVARHFYIHDSFKDTIIQEIKDSKLRNRGAYKYSCVNFILLKIMVENVMQKPMDKLLHDDFYARLGARTTTYNPLHVMDTMRIVPTEDDQFVRRQLIRGYVHDESAAFLGGVSGNAGLFSSAGDLAKLLQMYLNDGQYGGESYLSAATSRLFTQSKSPSSRRGLGFDKPSPGEGLAPVAAYGHIGFTGTCFWVDPTENLIYIFLSNRIYPNRSNNKLGSLDIRTRIQDAIYKAMIYRKTRKD